MSYWDLGSEERKFIKEKEREGEICSFCIWILLLILYFGVLIWKNYPHF
ncbi:MAG: hypothetical protein V1851_01715 [Patescibacteria group bacterium]